MFVALHISGNIDHMIFIYGTHMLDDKSSVCRTPYLRNHTSYDGLL